MRRFCYWLLLSCLFATSPALANPSGEDPGAMLDVWSDSASELMAEARVLYSQAAEEVSQYEVNLRDGKYKDAEKRVMGAIGNTSLAIVRLERLGGRLKVMAEPAGIDILLRAQDLQRRLQAVVDAYRQLPSAQQIIGTTVPPLQKLTAAKVRTLASIGTLFKQGKFDSAEKRMYEGTLDEFEPSLVWHSLNFRLDTIRPFLAAKEAIDNKMLELRKAAATEALNQRRSELAPKFNELQTKFAAAVKLIESTGKAEWDGKQVDGTELIAALHQAWRKAQLDTLRCRAIDWTRGIKGGVRPPSELDELEAAYAKLEASMGPTVEAIISADAARALPDIVPDLYAKYLKVLAEIDPSVASDTWREGAERGLTALRGKAPRLAQQVAAYEQATAETLRWRRRAAQAAARTRMNNVPTLELLLAQAAKEPHLDVTFLKRPAPALIGDVAAATTKQSAVATQLRSSSTETDSRYGKRTFARIGTTALPATEIAQLKQDLLVTEAEPPLTLAAAAAIASAERGTFVASGGEVTNVELQSLVVPMMTLQDPAVAVPLGPLPQDVSAFEPDAATAQVQYKFTIKPAWLQHEYIFYPLPIR